MKRASLIVVVRPFGKIQIPEREIPTTAYTCQSVHVNFDGTVTIFVSGTPSTFHQDEIVRIEYAPNGAEFCPWCDQGISQFS